LQRQHIRTEAGGVLFGQGVVIVGQHAGIQRTRDFLDPSVMKMMKDTRLSR
jgi:hypothetical protein